MRLNIENIESETLEAWRTYMSALEKSMQQLEADIDEAACMTTTCTSEWCEATEHVLDELNNALFSISEPRWSSDDDSWKLKDLKRRVHDIYAKYKGLPGPG